jgi:hypothetical protein
MPNPNNLSDHGFSATLMHVFVRLRRDDFFDSLLITDETELKEKCLKEVVSIELHLTWHFVMQLLILQHSLTCLDSN